MLPNAFTHTYALNLYKHNSTFNMKAFDFDPIFKNLNFDMILSNRELCMREDYFVFFL